MVIALRFFSLLKYPKLTCQGHAVNIYDDYAMELEDKKSELSPDDYEVPKPPDIDTEDILKPIIENTDVPLEEVVNVGAHLSYNMLVIVAKREKMSAEVDVR